MGAETPPKKDSPLIRLLLALAAIVLGLIAARFRLLDSWPAIITLAVIILGLIALGVHASAQPWDEWERSD
jgi:hypothetical protein